MPVGGRKTMKTSNHPGSLIARLPRHKDNESISMESGSESVNL
jgi:hypothetical protein